MKTNFFTLLQPFLSGSKLSMDFSIHEGEITIIIYPKPAINDPSVKAIPPLKLKGSPLELDEKFIDSLTTPLDEIKQFTIELDKWKESFEKAKKTSEMEAQLKKKRAENEQAADKKISKAEEYLKTKEWEKAIRYAQEATVIAPEYDKALKMLARAKKESGLFSQPILFSKNS